MTDKHFDSSERKQKVVQLDTDDRTPSANSRFAKAGVSCFYDSVVLNSSFVHLMKFSGENRHLRVAAKRYVQPD